MSAEAVVKDIHRKTRKKYSAEEKIRANFPGWLLEELVSTVGSRCGQLLQWVIRRHSALSSRMSALGH